MGELIPASHRPAMDKLDAVGVDAIVDMIYSGMMLSHIAKHVGVGEARLSDWIAQSPERSARIKAARAQSAEQWDEKAERVLWEADGRDAIARARELAHHYRWRASKLAPRTYGDKVLNEISGPGGGAIVVVTGVPGVPEPKTVEALPNPESDVPRLPGDKSYDDEDA